MSWSPIKAAHAVVYCHHSSGTADAQMTCKLFQIYLLRDVEIIFALYSEIFYMSLSGETIISSLALKKTEMTTA